MGIEKNGIIKVINLVKEYNQFRAVDNITFKVENGEIFGLLGPNGAGKTTTIRMLTGIIKPTKGTAIINDYDIQKNPIEAKQMIGVVPEMANAYVDLSALQNLLFMGELYGLKQNQRLKKAEQLLKTFKLYEKRQQKVKTFSKGMKQRILIAMALMNEAKILFLDEPTSGLDVESTKLLRGLIRKFNEESKTTIILTTHNIEEADQLCDRIAIMNYGKIVAIEHPEKLKQIIKEAVTIEISFENKVDKEKLMFKGIKKIEKLGDKLKLRINSAEEVIPALVDYSKSTKNKIISLNTVTPSLEDIFLKLTEDKK